MENWVSLNLLSIEKIITSYPDFNLRDLAVSLFNGSASLYVFIPFGEAIDSIQGPKNSLTVNLGYFDEDDEARKFSLSVWNESHIHLPGPYAVKLSRRSTSRLAEKVLSWLVSEPDERALEISSTKSLLRFVDDNGEENLILGRYPEMPNGVDADQQAIEDAILQAGHDEFPGQMYREIDQGTIKFSEFLVPAQVVEGLANGALPHNPPTSKTAGFGAQMAPHWGRGLRALINLSNRLWGENIVDRSDETTFPVNADVIREIESLGYNNRVAKDLAVAIRPDWGKAMVRKKDKQV